MQNKFAAQRQRTAALQASGRGLPLYLLGESYFAALGDDPEEITGGSTWPSICEVNSQSIADERLKQLLLEWYAYQNDQPMDDPVVLGQIGQAVTAACRRLNALPWPADKFSPDFAVFSQCMASKWTDYGIKASVTPEWLERMKAKGLFETWLS